MAEFADKFETLILKRERARLIPALQPVLVPSSTARG